MSGWTLQIGNRSMVFEGPFFQYDPSLRLRQNISAVVASLAEEGEKLARELTPVVTGEARDSLHAVVEHASLYSRVKVVPEGPAGSAAYPRAAWLESGVRRKKRVASHQKLKTTWNKERKGLGTTGVGVVHMKHRPPQPIRRAYLSLNRLKPAIEAELTKGLA